MTTDTQNSAVTKHTAVPPALIEAVASDATAAQPAIRAMALVQLTELHGMRHALTPVQRMQLAEVNAKLGDMVPRQAGQNMADTGFSITINIPQVGAQPGRVIDSVPLRGIKDVTDA